MPTLSRWDWVSAGKTGLEDEESEASAPVRGEVELSLRASLVEKKDVICL